MDYFTPEHWGLFSSLYKYIGVFREALDEETGEPMVYMDANAARILRMKFEDVQAGIPYEKFMAWIMSHSETPPTPQQHVYEYHIGSEVFLLKLVRQETPDGSIGFLQDMNEILLEQQAIEMFKNKDVSTGLLNREALINEIQRTAATDERGVLAVIHINGIENLNHWFGYNYSDRGLIVASKTLMNFRKDNIFLGIKSLKEFIIYFRDYDSSEVYRILLEISEAINDCYVTDDFGEVITNGQHLLSASIGYVNYNAKVDGEFDLPELLNKASFAMIEARSDRSVSIHPYTEDNFRKDREKYSDILSFMRLINDNLFDFFFQPIVETQTGNIFAYEMLMRTKEKLNISPERILEIATEKNQLYDVEKATISNALNIIHENRDIFRTRKIFVNMIPAHILNNDDYEDLRVQYADVMNSVIIEFTEQTEVSDEHLVTIQKRCREANMGLAIDDYGTGYSNVSSLLRYAPNYVKIDRALLTSIHEDMRKQHLVSNIVTFAHKYGILVLAEGIEKSEELKCVIALGADLIQGFYTGKPNKEFVSDISPDVKKEIISYHSRFNASNGKDIYNVINEPSLKLSDIDPEVYSEILINENETFIDGTGSSSVDLSIRTKPNSNCRIVMNRVNLKHEDSNPVLIVGDNSVLDLELRENNIIEGSMGIYVPSTSKLYLHGNGNLNITCSDRSNCFGIGCDSAHSFGNILIDLAGQLYIDVTGDCAVGIGGGHNASNSSIKIINSDIEIHTTGDNGLGIGSVYDDPNTVANNSSISMICNGHVVCGIGSHEHACHCTVDDCDISMECTGTTITALGAELSGYGSLKVAHSTIQLNLKGQDVLCLGTRDGYLNIAVGFTKLRMDCEASVLTGIGDPVGRGDVSIGQTTLTTNFNVSTSTFEYGSPHGELNMIDCKRV